MISVILPAHNESAVIERALRALTDGAEPGEIEILVVANGCSDDTADRARAFDRQPVRVLETEIGSKPNALNMGDAEAAGFPRIYADTDVDLPIATVRVIAEALSDGSTMLVSPRMEIDLRSRGWAVRAYYAIWTRLPYYKQKIGGVYALSEAGRARFEKFPDLIADDTFVAVQFSPDEQRVLQDATFRMTPPESIAQLIHIEVRRHSGSHELAERYPELMQQRRGAQRGGLKSLLPKVWLWPAMAVYLYVKLTARARLKAARKRGEASNWNRDESSRRA